MDIFKLSFVTAVLKILAFISVTIGFFAAFAMLATGNLLLVATTFFGALVSAAFIMAVVHVLQILHRIERTNAAMESHLATLAIHRTKPENPNTRAGSELTASRLV